MNKDKELFLIDTDGMKTFIPESCVSTPEYSNGNILILVVFYTNNRRRYCDLFICSHYNDKF